MVAVIKILFTACTMKVLDPLKKRASSSLKIRSATLAKEITCIIESDIRKCSGYIPAILD
jgi:hypothetical protein